MYQYATSHMGGNSCSLVLSALQGARALITYSHIVKVAFFLNSLKKKPDFGKIFYKHIEKANLF